jgi:hypothetical protein
LMVGCLRHLDTFKEFGIHHTSELFIGISIPSISSTASIHIESFELGTRYSIPIHRMTSSKKDKHYTSSRARRHSGTVVVTNGKKSRRDKDTDSESFSSSSTDAPILESKKCPLRFMVAGMLESDTVGERQGLGCPLRRVQLWHTIPLCLLAIINLLLVIVALLGLAGYRIATYTQVFLLRAFDVKISPVPHADDVAVSDEGSVSSGENG